MATSASFVASCAALSFVCFALSCVTVFLPYWGYFEDFNYSFGSDRGYFGPWRVCKELTYDRMKCGHAENISRFRPSNFVFVSGVMVTLSSLSLALYCVLCIIQIASRDKILLKSHSIVNAKLILAIVAGKNFSFP